ncbi:hypothetical protein KAR91_04125 [Candidatus Pacearchaeota archaeon]|nr:hypothetical protein [Candidatus Pacearchaeota archaeon]
MRLTTTDGKDEIIPDICGYCQTDTAGNHEPKCPCYVNPYITQEIDGYLFITFEYHPTIQQEVIVY